MTLDPTRPLTIALFGNLAAPHSTENELRKAFEDNGHTVVPLQEGTVRAVDVPEAAGGVDLLVWVQTYSLAEQGGTREERWAMLHALRAQGTPTLGLHADRWHGLAREDQIATEPYFHVDLLGTADGGHDREWAAAGVNHFWFPPGVSRFECEPADPDPRFTADLAFVGNWQGRYHPEAVHRRQLIHHLRHRWGRHVRMWPRPGQPAVRGDDLRTLYATVKIVVGDSCLLPGDTAYISDRVPETLGRGGFLLHPHVEGVTDGTLYTSGEHLVCWPWGDWAELDRLIGYYLAHDDERRRVAEQGRRHVLENHTYSVRVRQVLTLARACGLLDPGLRPAAARSGLVQEPLPALVPDG